MLIDNRVFNKFPDSWQAFFQQEVKENYFVNIIKELEQEQDLGRVILPELESIFAAFDNCTFADCKVIILGQDPYHTVGLANGMAFSVSQGARIPPSLQNIFKEISSDLQTNSFVKSDLIDWAKQGVLLLNAILTVNEGKPGSHKKIGWELFTDKIIGFLNDNKENLVFLLWGNFAKTKLKLIDENKHLVLIAPHPSPFSSHKGFFGSKHFSKTNQFLKKNKLPEIKW